MNLTNGAMGPVTRIFRIPTPVRTPSLPEPVREPVKVPEREPVKV